LVGPALPGVYEDEITFFGQRTTICESPETPPAQPARDQSFNESIPPVRDFSRGAIHPSVLSEVYAPQPPPPRKRLDHRSQWTTIVDSPETQRAQLARQAQNLPPPNPFVPDIPQAVIPSSPHPPEQSNQLRDVFYSQPNVPVWALGETEDEKLYRLACEASERVRKEAEGREWAAMVEKARRHDQEDRQADQDSCPSTGL
jgi:hypothetical protein